MQVSTHHYYRRVQWLMYSIFQCWIPVLEGILPSEHDKILLDLAFDMAMWHSYAKLHMHTTHTVNSF